MSNSLTATIKAAFGIKYTGDNISVGAQTAELPFHDNIQIGSGTGANQSDLAYFNTRTISASGNEDLDLAGGLADAFGDSLTFVEVTAVMIRAAAGNGGNIVFGPASSNGFSGWFGDDSDRISLAAGEAFVITNAGTGWTVTADTGDLLNVANDDSGAAASYDIAILGRSA